MPKYSTTSPLTRLLTLLDIVVYGSAILETIFFFGFVNLYATIILCIGWYIIRHVSLTERNLIYFPASFLMMFGLGLFYYALPMPLTLIEWKKVTYNLRIPFDTFTHHGIFVLVIAFTHLAYTTISGGRNPLRDLLSNTNFYRQPNNPEIWISALIGFLAAFYTYFIMGAWQVDVSDRGPAYYIASTFAQFIWMPLLLLFPKLRGIDTPISSLQRNQIIIYSMALGLVAIASNWRTILYAGIIVLALLALLSWLRGDFKIQQNLNLKSVLIAVGTFYLVTGPLIDFGYAMVSVRGTRAEVSATDLISETFRAYSNKAELDAAKKSTSRGSDVELLAQYSWNEEYLSNSIENRFVNLKISDNSLFYAHDIGTPSTEMQEEMGRQLLALLPNVALNTLGVSTEKKYAVAYSIGDYLYSLAANDSSALGSAVISSMPGVGMAIFGYWYILVLIPLFSVIFYLFDAMSTNWNGRAVYSYLFFTTLTTSMNYFNDRHVYVMDVRYVFRTYWESLAFFFACMYIVRLIASAMNFNGVVNQKQ